jgi:hypothetical protein
MRRRCNTYCRVFNSSTSKWLPWLWDAMEEIYGEGKYFALVQCVVARWTSTWMSCVSVLQANDALMSVMIKKILIEIEPAVQQRLQVLRRVVKIIESEEFWHRLSSFLVAMVPSIESSLVIVVCNTHTCHIHS